MLEMELRELIEFNIGLSSRWHKTENKALRKIIQRQYVENVIKINNIKKIRGAK